jgi:hypothetical protein
MIAGLTDKIIVRRAGKIRAGKREEGGKMINTPHFLLHDAPQLIPVLGEKPTEIYFTVLSNRYQDFFRDDLRWYSKNELMCVSTHEKGKAPTAAYMSFNDAPGVKNTPHPAFPKARERSCLYKSCPQYLEGKCGEHFFLDMIIPQYSLGPVFQLDNTSLLAIMNVYSAIQGAVRASMGRLQGEIFRLYKKEIPVSFADLEKMKKFNRDQAVIHLEHIPFETYEKKFQGKISIENWSALMGLRSGAISTEYEIGSDEAAQIEAAPQRASLPSPDEQDKIEGEVLARANNETVVKLLDQLSAMTGVPNTEENRIKLARNVNPPTVEGIVTYVNSRIAKAKKEKAATDPVTDKMTPPQVDHKPVNAAAAAGGTLF